MYTYVCIYPERGVDSILRMLELFLLYCLTLIRPLATLPFDQLSLLLHQSIITLRVRPPVSIPSQVLDPEGPTCNHGPLSQVRTPNKYPFTYLPLYDRDKNQQVSFISLSNGVERGVGHL